MTPSTRLTAKRPLTASLLNLAAATSGSVAIGRTSAMSLILFPTMNQPRPKPIGAARVIQRDVAPRAYTRPGPPMKPKPLMMDAKAATDVTTVPNSLWAPK